jgi:hypothetical protein
MRNNIKDTQPRLKSETLNEGSDFSWRYGSGSTFEQFNKNAKQYAKKKVIHKETEKQERKKADIDLEVDIAKVNVRIISESDLNIFLNEKFTNSKTAKTIADKYYADRKGLGLNIFETEIEERILQELEKENKISTADKIKTFKEQLTQQGKPPTEILQTLISKYENEDTISTWVENWKNFLKLLQYAKNKPLTERNAIQNIISNADFTSENAFTASLAEISNSTAISTETKLDIQRKFRTTGINTVRAFDYTLKQEKKYKKNLERKIRSRNTDIENLNDEIQNLNSELDNLPPDDPKRSKLEARIKKKSNLIKSYEQELTVLNEAKPEKVQFQLRNDLMGVLNPDGSRSINIASENFTIQLPGNKLPLMGQKNLRSINLAFTFKAFSQLGMDSIFTPKLKNGAVPDKQQRLFGRRILKGLGYKTDQILSQSSIHQLEKDLSKLKQKGSNTTGMEDLKTLEIWNITNQSVNTNRLDSCLNYIRENRDRQVEFEELKEQIIN